MPLPFPHLKRRALLYLADGLPHSERQIQEAGSFTKGCLNTLLRRAISQGLAKRKRIPAGSGVPYLYTYRITRAGLDRLDYYETIFPLGEVG